jgi:predicted patatin/cPLA2 family phospholipase
MPEDNKPIDLVLEGGGVKGIALLGAVLTFYDAGYRFKRIAGTSAGVHSRVPLSWAVACELILVGGGVSGSWLGR